METRSDFAAAYVPDNQLKIAILERALQFDVSRVSELNCILEKLVHKIDDGVARLAIVLTRICMMPSEHIAKELTCGAGMLPA
jgi:hypothetical protein